MADLWDRGIDVTSPAVRRGRSWPWFKLQVDGLLTVPPHVAFDRWNRPHLIPQTRLALALSPPDFTPPARAAGAAAAPVDD